MTQPKIPWPAGRTCTMFNTPPSPPRSKPGSIIIPEWNTRPLLQRLAAHLLAVAAVRRHAQRVKAVNAISAVLRAAPSPGAPHLEAVGSSGCARRARVSPSAASLCVAACAVAGLTAAARLSSATSALLSALCSLVDSAAALCGGARAAAGPAAATRLCRGARNGRSRLARPYSLAGGRCTASDPTGRLFRAAPPALVVLAGRGLCTGGRRPARSARQLLPLGGLRACPSLPS